MDVADLLAQKRQHLAERERAAYDEPEFVLTEREFDYRLRRAFAERERAVEKQVHKLIDQHMDEVEKMISDANLELAKMIAIAKAALPQALTAAEIDSRIAAAFEARAWEHEATVEAVGQALGETRKKLRAEFTEQIAKAHGGAEIVELPNPLRSRHG